MIGAFARMVGSRHRVLSVDDAFAMKTQTTGRIADHAATPDGPPERFVAKISDEGGDVYLSPMLETLRAWLRKQREAGEQDPSRSAPEGTTLDNRTERP